MGKCPNRSVGRGRAVGVNGRIVDAGSSTGVSTYDKACDTADSIPYPIVTSVSKQPVEDLGPGNIDVAWEIESLMQTEGLA